ncbi:hypothetical protein [Fischerella thermalis]|nr:hypothetical protein [Fischerella thermalis]
MMNRFICIVLSTAAIFGLVACNGNLSSSRSRESQVSPEPQINPGGETSEVPSQPRTEQVEAQKNLTAEATLRYWKSWKSSLESYKVAAEPLGEYSVENSTALSSLNTQLADRLVQLSAVDVDPELTEVAANAIAMYRNRARLLQDQANIISNWNAFVKKRDSDETAGVGIIVFLFNEKDRFAVPRALAEEANQIKNAWNNNLALINKQNQNIEVMIANREALKIKLESRHGVVFENF